MTPWRSLFAILILLSACGDSRVRVSVDGTAFCVPRQNIVDEDYWWIPSNLPSDGFRFRIASLSFAGETDVHLSRDARNQLLPVSGFVSAAGRYSTWEHPREGSYYFEQAARITSNRNQAANEDKYVRVFNSPADDAWVVWAWPKTVNASSSILNLATDGRVIAICTRDPSLKSTVSQNEMSATCSRVVLVDNFAIEYRIHELNLNKLSLLDQAIVEHIASWKCSS